MVWCAQKRIDTLFKELFDKVEAFWRQGVTGVELYRYATDQAEAMGWKLNLDIKRATGSVIFRMQFIGAAIWGTSIRRRMPVCGFWKSRSSTLSFRTVPSLKTCSFD